LVVEPLRGDLERLPFANDAFAGVVNEGVVEHWLDRDQRRAVLAEMARVARPGGVVAVYVPNGRHPLVRWWERTRYPGYASSVAWHKYGWRDLSDDLMAAGLRNVRVDGLSPYSTIAVWPHWWILRALAGLARRFLPEPRRLRLRCGFNLMAIGEKR
jgi:SAM-dependent methyltransferase